LLALDDYDGNGKKEGKNLLQKFGKLIAVGVVALLGFLKKLFSGLTGRQTADSANV